MDVAYSLAAKIENDYRQSRNSDPDGENYAFCAAEEGMREHDYFRARVWERQADIFQDLKVMPLEDQNLLIAWDKES